MEHGVGEGHGLLALHAANRHGHEERGGLVIGDRSIRHAGDPARDLVAGEGSAVPLEADQILQRGLNSVKARGRSWARAISSADPSGRSTRRISPGACSSKTWRQAPHGSTGRSVSETTARRRNPRAPRALAPKSAFRSAHIESPKLTLSTFTPGCVAPSSDSRTAA